MRPWTNGNTMALKVGDECMIVNRNFGDTRTRVVKVGRTNLYVDTGGGVPFDRESGLVKDNHGNRSIVTVAEYEGRLAEAKAIAALARIGVTVDRGVDRSRVLLIAATLRPLISAVPTTGS